MKKILVALVLGAGFALGVTQTEAGGPASVFIDDDNDCSDSSRQVASLPDPDADQVFYVWLDTGSAIDPSEVYSLVLVPLTPDGTTLVGPQPANFTQCSSSTWAYAEIGYGGIEPGPYAWLVFDSSGQLLGGDVVIYK